MNFLPFAGSSTHLAVLTSDNSWQLYHAGNLSHPEQRFELRLQRRRLASILLATPLQDLVCTTRDQSLNGGDHSFRKLLRLCRNCMSSESKWWVRHAGGWEWMGERAGEQWPLLLGRSIPGSVSRSISCALTGRFSRCAPWPALAPECQPVRCRHCQRRLLRMMTSHTPAPQKPGCSRYILCSSLLNSVLYMTKPLEERQEEGLETQYGPQIPLCRWKYCHLFACIV